MKTINTKKNLKTACKIKSHFGFKRADLNNCFNILCSSNYKILLYVL